MSRVLITVKCGSSLRLPPCFNFSLDSARLRGDARHFVVPSERSLTPRSEPNSRMAGPSRFPGTRILAPCVDFFSSKRSVGGRLGSRHRGVSESSREGTHAAAASLCCRRNRAFSSERTILSGYGSLTAPSNLREDFEPQAPNLRLNAGGHDVLR